MHNTKTILIICGELTERFVLKKLLKKFLPHTKIYTSEDGLQAIGFSNVIKPDLVVVDPSLPKYSGKEVINYLITNNKFLDIPVIILGSKDIKFNIELPSNYVSIDRRDRLFPMSLVKLIFSKLDPRIVKEKVKYLKDSSNRIINFLSKKIIDYTRLASTDYKEMSSRNILIRVYNFISFLFNQILVGIYLAFFYLFMGRRDYEENIEQKNKDHIQYRTRLYPQIGVGLAALLLIFLQLFITLSGIISLTFLSNSVVYAASYTWDGGGTDGTCGGNVGDGNKFSCAANWSLNIVPLATDSITFDSTSTKDAIIDAGFQGTVSSLIVGAGYTGTITQARSLLTTNTVTLSDGTYSAANHALTINRAFTMNTGSTFTASSGTTTFGAAFTINGGTFNHNSGTVAISDSGSKIYNCNNVVFNLVTITSTASDLTVNSNCTLPMGNNPTFTNGASISLFGSITGTGTFAKSQGTLSLQVGSTFSGFSGFSFTSTAILALYGGNLDFSGYTTFNFPTASNSIYLYGGTLSIPNNTTIVGNLILNGNGTFNAPNNFNLSGALTILGTTVFNANGGTLNLIGNTDVNIACNNAVFNLVTINTTRGKQINSDCNIPLGNNPIVNIGSGFNLNLLGRLTGTGTLTVAGGLLRLNSTSVLSGFTGLSSASLTNLGATIDFSSFSPFTVVGATTLTTGTLTFPSNSNFGSMTVNGSTVPTVTGNLTLSSFLTVTSGTFNAPTGLLTIGGNFTISGSSTFNHNNGTINFNGSNTLSCNNVTFNFVTFSNSGGKTVNSNCNVPLGDSPVAGGTMSLSGTVTGSGTVTFSGLNFNPGGSLSGFNGIIVSQGNFFINASTGNNSLDLSTYTTVSLNDSLIISAPSGSYTNTFIAPAFMSLKALNIASTSTFTPNGGTLSFIGSGGNLYCASTIFENVILNLGTSSNAITPVGDCTIKNLTINQGRISNPVAVANLNILGDFTQTAATSLGGPNLTLAFVGSGVQNISRSAGSSISKMVVNSSGSVNLLTNITNSSQTCSVLAGTLNLNGKNFTCTSGFTVANGATLQLFGNETSTVPTLSAGSNVKYVGNSDGLATTYTLTNWNYSNLIINSVDGTLDTFNFNNNFTPATLTLTAGTIEKQTATTLVVSGLTNINGATWNPGTLNITANGGLTCSSGSLNAATSTLTINGDLTISGCSMTAPSSVTTINGNFTHSSGEFIHNNGTIELTGDSRLINGSTIFNNLYKTVSIADTLTFEQGTTQTILGTLRLNGAEGSLLNLRSSSLGTRYNIDANTIDLGYLDISDFSNTNGQLIQGLGLNINDSGNNTGWNLHNPVVNSIGPSNLIDGSFTVDTTPTLNFNITDLDLSDSIKYNIQIGNNSDFTSLLIDSTSELEAGGDLIFDISTPIAPGNYFWRVKAIDASDGESNFYTANSGEVAFKEDFIPTVSALGPQELTDGSYINTRQPVFNFSVLDFDDGDLTVNTIQIDNNADFSSLEVDYTYEQGSIGDKSFTLGQAAGTGIYNTGTENQELADGQYYWRVKAVDNHSAESGFVYANINSVAFIVNSAPTVINLGPIDLLDGTYRVNRFPEFTFELNDVNTDDTIRYTIQVDNNLDFSSPEIDFTSELFSQGVQSYVNYTELTEDGAYYWRVKSIDNHSGESEYLVANAGEAAFNLNTVPVVTELGPLNLTDGSYTLDVNPSFNFTLSDVNIGDTTKYNFQLSNAEDFENLLVDYTSNFGLPGEKIFTVGQALDEGVYTVGTEDQVLPNANSTYYWRVSATDSSTGVGEFTNASTGTYAFGMDITEPTGSVNIEEINNNANPYLVNLIISGDDNLSGVLGMMISSNSDFTDGIWEDYRSSKMLTLSEGSGEKKIYVKLRDKADNVSDVLSSTIIIIKQIPKTEDQPTLVIQNVTTEQVQETTSAFEKYNLLIKIVNKDNKEVSNVKVTLHSDVQEGISNEYGIIKFTNVEKGKHTLAVSYKDYTDEVEINVGGSDEDIQIRIVLDQFQEDNTILYAIIALLTILLIVVGISIVRKQIKSNQVLNYKNEKKIRSHSKKITK